jgi:hypothetical protein
MSYIYFVSYVGATTTGSWFYGNCDLKMNKEIDSINDVRALETGIKKETGVQGASITVLNYSLLRFER